MRIPESGHVCPRCATPVKLVLGRKRLLQSGVAGGLVLQLVGIGAPPILEVSPLAGQLVFLMGTLAIIATGVRAFATYELQPRTPVETDRA